LLEALHRSREDAKKLRESLQDSEERFFIFYVSAFFQINYIRNAKLTREYERLVAKVQEEVMTVRKSLILGSDCCFVLGIFFARKRERQISKVFARFERL
jgi:hypothetical protein